MIVFAKASPWLALLGSLGATMALLTMPGVVLGGADDYQFYVFPPQDGYVYNGNYSAINDLGVVAGSVVNDDPYVGGASFWTNGVLTDVWSEHIDKGLDLFGFVAVSECGRMASYGGFIAQIPNSFVVNGDAVLELQVPMECQENGMVLGISRNGAWLAGQCRANATSLEIATLYDTKDGSAILLGFPPEAPPDSRGIAYAVNDHGTVVGFAYYPPDSHSHAFVFHQGEMREVPNPLGGLEIAFYDVNNQGIAIGLANDADGGNFLAISYDIETEELTVLGCDIALAINERGQAVGWDSFEGTTYAAIFEDGMTSYLNDNLPVGWTYPNAEDINNYGWVIGDANDEFGDPVHWLLVPIYDKGDYDGDEDVDLHDFGHFQRCFAADPYIDGTLHVGCSVFDFDDDVDLDLTDYDAFQAAFTGAITSGW